MSASTLPWQNWASCLTWLADRFVHAVHHSQDPAEIKSMFRQASTLTPPSGADPGMALAILLAACISPDRSVADQATWVARLGWELDEDAERFDREARKAS